MLQTLSADLDEILELAEIQNKHQQELAETRSKIEVISVQIQGAYKDLISATGRAAKNDALEAAQARLKLSELEKQLLETYQARHEYGVGSSQAKSAAKKELLLAEQVEQNVHLLRKLDWERGGLTGAEVEIREAIKGAKSELSALEEASADIIRMSLETEKTIDLAIQKFRFQFSKFDEIRTQSQFIARQLGLENYLDEISDWAQESLPAFEGDWIKLKRSLENLRVRGITRAAPLRFLLESQGVSYEDLKSFIIAQVPIFTPEICRSLVYQLTDDCIRALCRTDR